MSSHTLSRADALLVRSVAGMVAMLVAAAAHAQTPAAPPAAAAAVELEEIVVSGFRASLGAALNAKREAVTSVDAIVAEDIAKFPDQNLAESLQRIPGIAILRDGGEGRAISVRGLGAQFTRIRLNGMETVATSTDGASANRDRAFDFNVFASELFNNIVVHKTAEPALDEGSLGAVVDLNTGNPLAGKAGMTIVESAQLQNNSLSKDWAPRVAGLISWRNEAGTFGASVSAAYSSYKTLETGNNSVRWQQARFDSVNGTPCFYTTATSTTASPNTGGTYRASSACDAAALAFHPRIPRYGEVGHDRERLGMTAGLQWNPGDNTRVAVDGVFSRFAEDREEFWGEVLLRGLERQIDVASYTTDSSNNLISATLNDVPVRLEHYLRQSETSFHQLGTRIEHDVSDNLRLHVLAGMSESSADIPVETTIIFDDKNGQNYQYNYTDMQHPLLAFGTSVTTAANFQLSEIRDRPSNVTNAFRTMAAGAEWDLNDALTLKLGGVFRRFAFNSVAYSRDTVVCPAAGTDRVLRIVTCSATSNISDTAVYGYPVTPNLAQTFVLGSAGQPAGTTGSWIVPNLPATTAYTGLYNRTPVLDAGNNRNVVERASGGYLQLDGRHDVGTMELRFNAGARYVETYQRSVGIQTVGPVTVTRKYNDWLPSGNVALWLNQDMVIRAAASKVLTRPTLGNLTPGGTVDGFNFRVNFGNPLLEPFRANAYDLSFEYYFAPQAIASVAVFRKDVQSFPVASTFTGTFASTGLPTSAILPSSPAAANPEAQPWTITSIVNGSGAKLKGVELQLQSPFTFLPGLGSSFGGIANATFVSSDADYRIGGPAVTPGGGLVTVTRNNTLLGVSKRSYNGTLYYEDDKFSARVSGSYRSPFVDGTSATGNFFEGYASSFNLDASLKYRLSDELEVSLEGINLTDDYRQRFTDVDTQRNYENNHFGRTFMFGVRYKM